ncbi:MAG: DNA-formamidopyrimidine glycosylase family protein [Planctomycetaceae bacterium]
MPEGDTILRTAINLRKVLPGREIVAATGRRELMEPESLDGRMVCHIEARGKHLLIHFDDARVLHSHMGMTGSWHIYRHDSRWQRPVSHAVFTMKNSDWVVVCFTPKMIKLITNRELMRDSYLQRLGPDILGPPIADDVVIARFRTQDVITIGEAVMNQTVVCGIGNIYKSEILFAERIHPLTRVGELSDDQLIRIRDRAVDLMRKNIYTDERRTRMRGDGFEFWAYGRNGEPCLVCGTRMELIRQGDLARTTCFCPECQHVIARESPSPPRS